MKKSKKEILSLLLASTLVLSTSGCGSKLKKEYNVTMGATIITGTVSYNDLDEYYIVEIKNINNEIDYYLSQHKYKAWVFDKIIDLDSSKEIGHRLDSESYITEYGEFISVLPIKEFVIAELGLKDNYNLDDIRDVYKKVISDYDNLKENENVKKLIKTNEN